MESILIGWGTKIAAKLGELALGESRYLICFKCIAEEFEKEKEKLIDQKTSVEEEVATARNNVENIRYEVKAWLKKAEKYINEKPKQLFQEKEDTTKTITFLHRFCPKCLGLYLRGKELEEMKLEISELMKQNFEKVGRAAKVPGVEFYAPQNFIDLKSRTSAYKEVLEALRYGDDYIVGLHGLGGTGKTTLAKKVGLELKQEKVFDEVFFTTVSNDPDIIKIQDEIADTLGLTWKDETETTRPKKLWSRLTNGDKILLILDDVWKKLNFDAIGIPLSSKGHCCRVLLTSRDAEVCNLMECEKPIKLEPLSDADAQILFKSLAGISNKSPRDVKDMGKELAKECKGLPVAIATIASTLKGRHPKVWKAALTDLKSVHDTDEMIKIYKQLKVSYDHLNNNEAKKLLMLCSLFPEDYEIPVEDFVSFGIGLGLFENVHSYEAIRNRVDKANQKLIDSCLLLEGEEGHVKMHDLVRDAAHWIANQEDQFRILNMVPGKNVAEKQIYNEVRYLYCRGIFVNDQLDWTKLQILILANIDRNFVEVQEAFFGRMKNLRVLALDGGGRWWRLNLPLPQSFELLKYLQTLRLTHFKLDNMTIVGSLQSLEILELSSCVVDELSVGIVKLEKLRLLSLTRCEFNHNPYKVIGQLSSIQELYVKNIYTIDSRRTWDLNKEVTGNLFGNDGTSTTLQRYHIELRDGSESYNWAFDRSISRALVIQYFDPKASNAQIMDLVRRTECLDLIQIQGGYKAIIPDIIEAIGDMNELNSFTLKSCSEIKYLIHATNIHSLSMAKAIFSNLVELELSNMDTLRTLCYSCSPQELSFDRLKLVYVKCCPLLTSIFTLSIAHSLVALEVLVIDRCRELKYIIAHEQSGEEEIVKDGHNQMFPKLKTLKISKCDQLELIFLTYLAGDLQQLETIKISSCGELKYIFGQSQLEDQVLHQNEKEIILPSLETMKLKGVPKFVNMFPKCCHPKRSSSCLLRSATRDFHDAKQQGPHKSYSFPWTHMCCFASAYKPKLRKSATNTTSPIVSKILQTSNFVCVRPFDTAQCLLGQSLILRTLIKITLINCGEITSLFSLSIAARILLEELTIDECHGLKHVVTYVGNDCDCAIFPKLTHFSVENCSSLEFIFGQSHYKDLNQNIELDIKLPTLEDFHLSNLEKIISISPKSCYVTCPSLKEFYVEKCLHFTITATGDSMIHFDTRQMDYTAMKTSNSECFLPIGITQCLSRELPIVQNVKSVKLKNCGKIKSLFTVSAAATILWEGLTIEECHELRYIIIDMGNNHDRKYIFPKLKELEVNDCSNLKCMVGPYHYEGFNNNAEVHIDLPALEDLSLRNLPLMVRICAINNYYAAGLPLNNLLVYNCPEFVIKSVSDFMVRLNAIQLDDGATTEAEELFRPKNYLHYCIGVLTEQVWFLQNIERIVKPVQTLEVLCLKNTKTEGIFCLEGFAVKGGQTVISCSNEMKLKYLPDLKYIWKGPKNFLSLENLNELQIKGCDQLEVIFSASIFGRIPLLKKLIITKCQKLEQIVEENEENAVSPQLCFPELMALVVKDCNSLKHVLSISSPNQFPKLKIVMIAETSQLEEVFRAKLGGENEIEEPKQVVLPELTCLVLAKLPNLTNVCRWRGFELERVEYQIVHDCNSNITLTSTADFERLKDDCLDIDDPMDLGYTLRWKLEKIIDQITESGNGDSEEQETTIEAATESESEQSSSQHLNREPSSKDHQQAHGIPENTIKIPQEINSIEQTEDQSLKEHSKSEETENVVASSLTFSKEESVQSNPSINPLHKPSLQKEEQMDEDVSELSSMDQQENIGETKQLSFVEYSKSHDVGYMTVEEAEEHIHQKYYCPKSEENVEENLSKKAGREHNATSWEPQSSPSPQEEQMDEHLRQVSATDQQESIEKIKEQSFKEYTKLKEVDHMEELVGKQLMSEPRSKDQQQLLEKTKNTLDNSKATKSNEEMEEQHLQIGSQLIEDLVAENGSTKANHAVASTLTETKRAQLSISTTLTNNPSEGYVEEPNLEIGPKLIEELAVENGSTLSETKRAQLRSSVTLTNKPSQEELMNEHYSEQSLKDRQQNIIGETKEESPEDCSKSIIRKVDQMEELMGKHLSEPSSKDQQKTLGVGETENSIRIHQQINDIGKMKEEKSDEYSKSEEADYMEELVDEASAKDNQKTSRKGQLCPSITLVNKASQTETYIDMDSTVNPLKLQDVEGEKFNRSMDKDEVAKIAKESPADKDNVVAKVLADVEVYLKMCLKDLASSNTNSIRLQTCLNFLSRLSAEDGALSNAMKLMIDSLRQEFPGTLSTFKEAFAKVKKFAEFEEIEKSIQGNLTKQAKADLDLSSKISRINMLKEETQQKEATFKNHISTLQAELECTTKHKSQMVEKQSKAQQKLLKMEYEWSFLCSQFQHYYEAHMASTSTHFGSGKSSVVHLREASPQGEVNQTKDKDAIQACMPMESVTATGSLVADNPLLNVLADLQVCLKMSLKDTAASEDNSLGLHTALNFLSRLSFEGVALSDELKATINSLHQNFPSILCSFTEAFAVTVDSAEPKEREKSIEEELVPQKQSAITFDFKCHKTRKFVVEVEQKEAILKERISWLQVELQSVKDEIKELVASLTYLQEEKTKCVEDIERLEMELETVKRDKHPMVEDQRKAQKELFQMDYKWSALCSRFEMSRFADRRNL